MCNEKHRCVCLRPDLQQLELEPLSRDLVQRPERLIHKKNVGAVCEGSCYRHAGLHTSRQLPRIGFLEARQADLLNHLSRTISYVDITENLTRQSDVLEDGAPLEQRRILEKPYPPDDDGALPLAKDRSP